MKTFALLLLALGTAAVQAQTTATQQSAVKPEMSAAGPGKWDQAIAAGRIEPGMPTYIAVGLLGREPDQAAEVGAACGMLDVLTWHQEQTRIVTSDGVVTSVTTASKP